ncbi:hypothetical protein BC828DRAFT_392826 [Blastocladiella britannica]|nr:hypothetical protein BC828DRAFT_392826 [Blastocladiella britannica]
MSTSSDPPPISDAVAVNSLIATGILLAYSLTSLYRSVTNTFPVVGRWITKLFGGKSKNHKSRKCTLRDWMLISSAVLLIVDTFNKFAMLSQFREFGTANYLVYRIFEIMALHSVTYTVFFAIALRCTIIVLAKSPALRKKIVWGFGIFLVVVFFEQKVSYLLTIAQMVKQGNTAKWWIQARITPFWLTLQVALLILGITGVSVWSVIMAFHDPSQLQSRASSTAQTGSARSGTEKSSGNGSSGGGETSTSGPTLTPTSSNQVRKSSIISATVSGTTSMSTAKANLIPPASTSRPTVPNSVNRLSASGPASSGTAPVSSLQQNLTITFAVLSFVVVASYIVHLIVILMIEDKLPMIQGIWTNFILNTLLATELSFDTLLRWSARRQRQK